MPVEHAFVSGVADGGDATLIRPSDWNADHIEPYAPGSFTIATGRYVVMAEELQLTGTQEVTIEGTATLVII